ncbi:MAG TPA: hypothetical protein VF725_03755 [Ktedonobacterales bacterium]|jgi:hypothetical protein
MNDSIGDWACFSELRMLMAGTCVLLAVATYLAASPTAFANQGFFPNCVRETDSSSSFDGAQNENISGVTGATAEIGSDNPIICNQFPRGSASAWSMLDRGPEYAQVGWTRDYSMNTPEWFDETDDANAHVVIVYLGFFTVGSTHTYKVTYNSGSFNFYVDGSWLDGRPQDWSPQGVEFMGEAHDTADQMPGGYSAYIYFTSVEYLQGHTWSGGNLTAVDDFPNSAEWWPGGLSFGIYDTLYSS